MEDQFPKLLAWTCYCYDSEAPFLWSSEDSIPNVRGVQRGDPLGPFFSQLLCRPSPQNYGKVCKNQITAPRVRCCYPCDTSTICASFQNTTSCERLLPSCSPMKLKPLQCIQTSPNVRFCGPRNRQKMKGRHIQLNFTEVYRGDINS